MLQQVPVRYAKARQRYCSYIGEISPAPPNHVNRNFHAAHPYTQMLTDVTEFAAGSNGCTLPHLFWTASAASCSPTRQVATRIKTSPPTSCAQRSMHPPARSQALKAGTAAKPLLGTR